MIGSAVALHMSSLTHIDWRLPPARVAGPDGGRYPDVAPSIARIEVVPAHLNAES